jgi:hypothetical protein
MLNVRVVSATFENISRHGTPSRFLKTPFRGDIVDTWQMKDAKYHFVKFTWQYTLRLLDYDIEQEKILDPYIP